MHGPTHQHLDCFQIHTSAFPNPREDYRPQVSYFLYGFPLDRFGRFFSCGVTLSSSGRKRQIRSLSSTKDRLSCCQRRKASISRSAFHCANGLAKLSVTVLPFSL
jgi:hypothetical protein